MKTARDVRPPFGVAYILPGLGRGGTEKHVLDLASSLDRARFSPCVICTATDDTMGGDYAERGIPVFQLPYRGLSWRPAKSGRLFRDARMFFRSFAKILAERGIVVVHAYLPAANVLGMAGALGRGVRVRIVSKRALTRYKDGHRVYTWFEDLANWAADAVMVNSRAVAEDVRKTERFTGDKMFLVHNGLEIPPDSGRRKPPLPADLKLPPAVLPIVYVANLREDKGHLWLVEAARAVVAEFPAVRFLFVGREDREAAPIRAKIRELGLERHILLTGSRRDVAAIVDAALLVAHPGVQEGLSNAILEAMAAGVPVVASRAGGNPEAVVDGETGRLVPPGDPAALASAILEMLRDPARCGEMGLAARERVRTHFSLRGMVAAMEQTYLELIDGRSLSLRI